MKTEGFVSLAALDYNSSQMLDAYKIAYQAQAATNELGKVVGSMFGMLRRSMCEIHAAEVKEVGDLTKIDYELLRAKFNLACAEVEKWDETPEAKAFGFDGQPDTWTQAKSQLGIACEFGFNFSADPEVGQSALRNWVSKQRKAAKEAKEKATLDRAKAAGILGGTIDKDGATKNPPPAADTNTDTGVENPQPGGDAGDLPAGAEGAAATGNGGTPLPAKGSSIPVGGTNLSKEQVEKLQKIVHMMEGIATVKGNKALDGVLTSLSNQVTPAYNKIAKALEGMAKAS
jgi:hypothetical protein